MPIYDYRCHECGKVSEVFLRSFDSPAIRCPHCGSERVKKLFSASYVVRGETRTPGTTCCGRTERCETPPCSTDDVCRRR
jgi:putative FmdB family regulatory protein